MGENIKAALITAFLGWAAWISYELIKDNQRMDSIENKVEFLEKYVKKKEGLY